MSETMRNLEHFHRHNNKTTRKKPYFKNSMLHWILTSEYFLKKCAGNERIFSQSCM